VKSRHRPACAPQIPCTLTLCTNSSHPYQNKSFADQDSEFLSLLFSHCCALSRPQALCFYIVHENTRGEGVTPVRQLSVTSDQRAGGKRKAKERRGQTRGGRGIPLPPLRDRDDGEGERRGAGLKSDDCADLGRRSPAPLQGEPKNRSKGRPLRRRKNGPPRKDGPYIRRRKFTAKRKAGTMYRAPTSGKTGGMTAGSNPKPTLPDQAGAGTKRGWHPPTKILRPRRPELQSRSQRPRYSCGGRHCGGCDGSATIIRLPYSGKA